MAKKEKQSSPLNDLPPDTPVEVFAFKGDKTVKTEMSFGDFMAIVDKKGWILRAYQKGFNPTISTK